MSCAEVAVFQKMKNHGEEEKSPDGFQHVGEASYDDGRAGLRNCNWEKIQLVFQALLDYNPSGRKTVKVFDALPDGRFG